MTHDIVTETEVIKAAVAKDFRRYSVRLTGTMIVVGQMGRDLKRTSLRFPEWLVDLK